jgi:hypothetical protein
MSLDVVSGTISTVSALEKDEAWLQGWLKEKPARLGLGDLQVSDGEPSQDDAGNPAFVATDDGRCFSVNVRLGEMEAAHGFSVLDDWARNRVRHPDKDHVAVLVTETTGERYRPTLQALAEHLPLVVIELQAWRGESEAIIVPHVALASEDVDLAATPAAKAAAAVAAAAASKAGAAQADGKPATAGADGSAAPAGEATTDKAAADAKAGSDADAKGAPDADASASSPAAESGQRTSKDDTGIQDPWGLPKKEPEAAPATVANGSRLLSKFGS